MSSVATIISEFDLNLTLNQGLRSDPVNLKNRQFLLNQQVKGLHDLIDDLRFRLRLTRVLLAAACLLLAALIYRGGV